MGCVGSTSEKTVPLQTPENTVKILCLGVGGCGKTTFVKQLKIINHVPWKDAELQAFVKAIKSNYIRGLQDAIEAVKKLGFELTPENEEKAKDVNMLRATSELNNETVEILKSVWQDPAIKTVIERHGELLTVTHLNYFWNHFDRVMQPDFVPNDEDILRARVRTAGANSSVIYVDKRFFEFFDVGGQKPERAKWEYVFNENKFATIIYFVAVDEFDVENEDKDTDRTKMEISRFIFSELVNSNVIQEEVPVVLFLNRTDLFEGRMKHPEGFQSFQETFPNYSGGQNKTKGLEYLRDLFLSVTNRKTNIKYHFTCTLDRDSLVVVWRTVKESLLNETLNTLGLGGPF